MAKNNQNFTLTKWAKLSSTFATLMFVWSIICQYAPYKLRRYISSYTHQLFDVLSPYIHLSIDEFPNYHLARDKTFGWIQAYLGENGSKDAKRLRLSTGDERQVLTMDEFEEVTDRFNGVKVWWALVKRAASSKESPPMRSYKLTFHRKDREFVGGEYLDHVINEGKRIQERNRPRRLYLNSFRTLPYDPTGSGGWTSVAFDHPASFDSLAMEPEKKREIVEDLWNFSKSKEFYSRIGKAWKRGYLLYGPPGTGKSTLVAAMANLLEYDVYDLELTAVKDNTELKRLLINTNSRSVIVIEDIDCSINLTGKRNEKVSTSKVTTPDGKKKETATFTLSGLLNFIDGIWSACGGERIIVFTTNYVKKLDPALIRTGRMDKHIELSYCGFEGFKVLAKNYLLVEAHPKFDVIKVLLGETKMTPADVAENLMPKFPNEDAERCLENLIRALEKSKSDAAKREELKLKKKAEDSAKAEEAKQEASQKDSEELKMKEPKEDVEKKEGLSQANGTST